MQVINRTTVEYQQPPGPYVEAALAELEAEGRSRVYWSTVAERAWSIRTREAG